MDLLEDDRVLIFEERSEPLELAGLFAFCVVRRSSVESGVLSDASVWCGCPVQRSQFRVQSLERCTVLRVDRGQGVMVSA